MMTSKRLFITSLCILATRAQLRDGYEPDYLQKEQEEQYHRHLQVQPPELIWGPNPHPQDGPWPECEGQMGIDCKEYIESWTGANPNVAQRGSTDTFVRLVPNFFSYDASRVWIHCDHRGNVVFAPKRG